MLIIPAIDLKDGKCVRLKQGRMEDSTIYSDSPDEVAVGFQNIGVKRLHIVDLNGAFSGKPENINAIQSIIKSANLITELGGGIRDLKTIEKYFNLGLNYIILGTVIIENENLVKEAAKIFPDKIIAGIDALDGKVAIKGWKDVTNIDALSLSKKMEQFGVREIIYTDIGRDGMQMGVNLERTENLQKSISIPVIASGGVKDINDIKALKDRNIFAAITGKAVYEGTLNLQEALNLQ